MQGVNAGCELIQAAGRGTAAAIVAGEEEAATVLALVSESASSSIFSR